jgi:hypothetical protein
MDQRQRYQKFSCNPQTISQILAVFYPSTREIFAGLVVAAEILYAQFAVKK